MQGGEGQVDPGTWPGCSAQAVWSPSHGGQAALTSPSAPLALYVSFPPHVVLLVQLSARPRDT